MTVQRKVIDLKDQHRLAASQRLAAYLNGAAGFIEPTT
jgi:hypothetical protein